MSVLSEQRKMRFYKGALALLMGCVLNHFGDRLLGVTIELYTGLQGFGGMWILDLFALPFMVGMVVSFISGMSGKWLSYFPPLIVRSISYFQVAYGGDIPQDAVLIPLGWWGFFVILAIEASAFGGIIGEVLIKGTYGRSPRHKIYKDASSKDENDTET